jgi:hypothetical protein
MMVLNFIVLVIAFFSTLQFLISTISDITSFNGFSLSEEDNKQRLLNAKYRLVLSAIMSLSWTYVILLI